MAEREPIMAGQWKMHKDHLEAIQLVQKLAYNLKEEDYEGQEVVVTPPFTALRSVQTLIESDHLPLKLAAQNCHWEREGAYTGEISPPMLVRLNVRYVVLGHSERRQLFGETDEMVNRKVKAVLAHDMCPIVCVGETEEERSEGRARDVVLEQLTGSLEEVKVDNPHDLVIAYEPVWAIGTGQNATPEDAEEMCAAVRETLGELYDEDFAAGVRVQYGGSMDAGNVRELMSQPDIDGGLVGSASLSADDFAPVVGWRRR